MYHNTYMHRCATYARLLVHVCEICVDILYNIHILRIIGYTCTYAQHIICIMQHTDTYAQTSTALPKHCHTLISCVSGHIITHTRNTSYVSYSMQTHMLKRQHLCSNTAPHTAARLTFSEFLRITVPLDCASSWRCSCWNKDITFKHTKLSPQCMHANAGERVWVGTSARP
jgi:hypothetical protein